MFEKFSEDNNAQMDYFETRAEDIASTKRKISGDDYVPTAYEKKSTKVPPMLDISKIHSPEFFEKRLENIFSSKAKSNRLSVMTHKTQPRKEEKSIMSPESLLTSFNLNHIMPLSTRKVGKSPRSINKESSSTPKSSYGFGNPCAFITSQKLISEQDLPAVPKKTSTGSSPEFNFEKTLKMLTEQAKLRRSSCRDIPNGPRPGMFYKRSSISIHNGS